MCFSLEDLEEKDFLALGLGNVSAKVPKSLSEIIFCIQVLNDLQSKIIVSMQQSPV